MEVQRIVVTFAAKNNNNIETMTQEEQQGIINEAEENYAQGNYDSHEEAMGMLCEDAELATIYSEPLKPYTIEELHERIAQSERDFAEGRYMDFDDFVQKLEAEFAAEDAAEEHSHRNDYATAV